jgi:hypothetical protein
MKPAQNNRKTEPFKLFCSYNFDDNQKLATSLPFIHFLIEVQVPNT